MNHLQHFVRHHEAWLVEAGVDVDLWRKSCAPIARGATAATAAARGGAAAAAGSGKAGDVMAAAAAVLGDDDGLNGRKGSSTRLADGECADITSLVMLAPVPAEPHTPVDAHCNCVP